MLFGCGPASIERPSSEIVVREEEFEKDTVALPLTIAFENRVMNEPSLCKSLTEVVCGRMKLSLRKVIATCGCVEPGGSAVGVMKPGLPAGGGLITGLPVAEDVESALVLDAWNVSVSPSVVIVACVLGIGMVCPLSTMLEGPMVTTVPSSVIVVEDEAGTGTVWLPITTVVCDLLEGLALVGAGTRVRVLPSVVIVVALVIDVPDGSVKMVVDPFGSVRVCTFDFDFDDGVGFTVNVDPSVVRVVRPVIVAPFGNVSVTRPPPEAVNVSTKDDAPGLGIVGDAVGHLSEVGWMV